ncbi:MAG: DUF3313 domain-containing protein [Acidimicrobiia bacterium]
MKSSLAPAVLALLLVAGCATTKQAPVQDQAAVCGFLGDACQMLKPGQEGEASERWVNPNAQFTQYNKVMINVVGFFGADTSKVPPKDQQSLTDLFHKSLTEEIGKKYSVVEQAGSGVLKVQVAILDAEAATPGMRSISMAVPQLRMLTTATSLGTEKFPFAGGAEAAAKITDSVTGQLLAAGVDRRMGGSSMRAAAQWEWGDAENAIKAWAELMATNLYAYTSGAKKP